MNKFRFTINVLAIAVFTIAFASMAQAQATRTWVSGVGDDVNPCSRTAPCKTFAGAISKTAKDGEISVLDPGGFGAVTITKSITINGTHGAGFGSILAAGTNGIIINITDAADVRKTVRIVALNINGASSGINGIRILSASNVYIEDTIIDGFTNRGIDAVSSIACKLVVKDSTVRNCVQSCITVIPTGGTTTALLDNVRATGSTSNSGYAQSGSVKSTLRNCYLAGNSSNGVFADGTGEMNIVNCIISHNATGISVTAPAVIRLQDSTLMNNTTASINAGGTGQVSSTGTNFISGNGANNLPAGPAINPS